MVVVFLSGTLGFCVILAVILFSFVNINQMIC